MNTILMIRPVRFGYNEQTAVNNSFQKQSVATIDVNKVAQAEFDAFELKLRHHAINVAVIEDTPLPHTPDSIFPNNWISFHENGCIVLYPMFAKNRRLENKPHVLDYLKSHFLIRKTLDFSHYVQNERFVEGTGSLVLDRTHKLAYVCISPRTDQHLAQHICDKLGYRTVFFHAVDKNGVPIYHTNVMMCVADHYAVVAVESIVSRDRETVLRHLRDTGKEVVAITHKQIARFAGNMLQVPNRDGIMHLVMSQQAWHSLDKKQQHYLANRNPIIHSRLDTIEQNGGGSARCMMAEIYTDTP